MNVPSTSAAGKAIFEAKSFRTKDDSSDPFVLGVFTHNPIEFSATEAAEWVSFFLWLIDLMSTGAGGIKIRQNSGATLKAGTPVAIASYDFANEVFIVVAADAVGVPAVAILLADLATGTNGMAYLGGSF